MDEIIFPITLVSNVDGENNTLANFTTELPRDISLEGQWGVALSEIQYTKSWFNIRRYFSVGIADDKSVVYQSPEKVVPGVYESPLDLIREINRCVEQTIPSVVSGRTRLQKTGETKHKDLVIRPTLEYSTNTRRVIMREGKTHDGRKLYIYLESELNDILGFDRDEEQYDIGESVSEPMFVSMDQEIVKGDQDALWMYDLHCGIHSLMVYCDLIKPIITGNTYTQLLRAVPVTHRKFGDQCSVTFVKPYFFPIATNNFRSIEISIRDDTGSLIPFKFGRTIVVLEFKKL